ncbi:MAG: diacylglycerol/lipid kinase family protein [Planctomycetota bacterium]
MPAAVLSKTRSLQVGVITNPTTRRNRGRSERLKALEDRVGARGLVIQTRTLADLREALQRLLAENVQYIVADGGDGTLNRVVNETFALVGRDASKLPIFVPTNGGTMNFVARRVGVRGCSLAVLDRLAAHEGEPEITEVPTLRLRGMTQDGEAFDHVGFCTAVAGIGQRFFARYYAAPKQGSLTVVRIILRGLLSMVWTLPGIRSIVPERFGSTVRSLTRPQTARVVIDGEPVPETAYRALDVGAIPANLGGVVRLFPLAVEGRLHALVGCPSLFQIARVLPRLIFGRTLRHGVRDASATSIEVSIPEGAAPLDPVMDGECFFGLDRVTVTPGPKIRCPRI